MKAPDKIFVNADPFGFMCAYDIENHPSCGEEYIRKDALLEWLKDMIDYSSKERRGAYQNVIDKIESL